MSTRYNTGNPIESTDVRDMSDNAKNFDEFSNSTSDSFIDRFGRDRQTIDGSIRKAGFQPASFDFVTGGTLVSGDRNKAVFNPEPSGDNNWYAWQGEFPKIISPSSTPATSGGLGENSWKPVTNNILATTVRESIRRSYAEVGCNLVAGSFQAGFTLSNPNDVVLDYSTGKAFSGAPGTYPAGTSTSGFVDFSTELHRTALPIVSPTEKRFAGGADPTGVADSTDALQACIDYCAPFEWKGSVSATKAAMGAVVAAIGGFGKFRITRPLKINPFLVIDVNHNGAFFGSNGGFQIVADFDDKDNFALDTAPYNSSGVRELGRIATRNDWDAGLYTGCPGWVLQGVEVYVVPGRNLRGTLNRCIAQQSVVTRCSMEGGNAGIQNSCSWGGALQMNHIRARAIPMLNLNDVTVDEQQANYLTVSGVKPVAGTEFAYPTWPDAALQGKTTPVHCHFSHPNFFHNILEGGEVAAMCTNQSRINLDDNYVEGSGYQYVYALHSVNVKIGLRWVIAANAGLLWTRFSNVELDASACSYMTVADWGDIDSNSSIKLIGSKIGLIAAMPFNSRVEYTDIDVDGVVDIYANGTGAPSLGVDTNYGYSPSRPVLTLQEAIDRCISGKYNRIHILGVVGTKQNYTSGGTVTNKVVNLQVAELNGGGTGSVAVGQSSNQIQGLPAGIANVKLVGLSVSIPLVNDNYKPFVACHGVVNIEVDTSTITGAGTLMGVKYGYAGMGNLTAKNSTIACALQHNGATANAFSWIDTAITTSVVGGSVGAAGSKKISSVLYP